MRKIKNIKIVDTANVVLGVVAWLGGISLIVFGMVAMCDRLAWALTMV